MPSDGAQKPASTNWQLALGTLSFALCFAAWGLISAFAPRFRETFHLTATQTAFLVAVPVLLGALMRIVTGMLADRFGGRLIFALLMVIVAVPAFLVSTVGTYRNLLIVAFFLGVAGSSFAVGVGFVSRWFPPERQGGALGVYGLGNIGQSAAVFLGPVRGAIVGWHNIFRGERGPRGTTRGAHRDCVAGGNLFRNPLSVLRCFDVVCLGRGPRLPRPVGSVRTGTPPVFRLQ